MMRKLTSKEIEKLASRKGVRRIAVENFLATMGENEYDAKANLIVDSCLYRWNGPTKKAIRDGILLACREADV